MISPWNVYILGAGASKDFGYPLISDVLSLSYLHYIEREIKSLRSKKYKGPFRKHYRKHHIEKLKSECEYFLSYGLHIEELMMYFEEKKEREELNRLINYYRNLLILVDNLALNKEPDIDFLDFVYISFITETNAIISFNHDLFIEHTLSLLHTAASISPPKDLKKQYFINYNLGYDKGEIKNLLKITNSDFKKPSRITSFIPMDYPTDGQVPILKLHGSLSLFECNNCKEIFYFPASYFYLLNIKRCPSCGVENWLNNFIVPPNRQSVSPHLKSLWNKALQIIKTSRIIYIIGYSLPDYDNDAKELLYLGTKDFDDKEIFIINNGINNDLINRYSSILKNVQYINRGFRNYIDYYKLLWGRE